MALFNFITKAQHREVKGNKIRWEMCKSGSIFPYLKSSTLFKWLLKFISWYCLSKKWMVTVPEEKCPSFNFIR